MQAADLREQVLPRRLAPDPGLANLRLATRAAVTQPLVFGFALLVLHNVQITLFAVFAVFSLLVLANFGGRARDRASAFAVTTLVGGVMVAAGTLASPAYWSAALVALPVVFAIEYAGVFGGYVGGSQVPLLMGLVLAASVPAAPTAIPDRVFGWWLGGSAATVAALLLWPGYEHDALITSASGALRSLAMLIAASRVGPVSSAVQQDAARAVARFKKQYSITPYRPGGLTRRDRAFAQLLTEIDRAAYFATTPPEEMTAANPSLQEGDALASAVVSVFEASAQVLGGGPTPALRSVQDARIAHRAALDAWAGSQLRSGADAESVLAGLDYDHRLRVLARIALAAGADAAIAAGRDFDPRGLLIPFGPPLESGFPATLRRMRRTLSTHLSWTSPVLHTSIRAAIGLAIAVLVARLFGLDRAFWVVLGTMSVLRSNAFTTGRTAVQAIAGTLLGFLVGGLFTLLFAHDPIVMWLALPLVVFLAAYTPSALSFVLGQGAFTVLMLVVFNLLTPVGWTVGLVRIEDLLVGAAIGVAAGVLLWPSGARADFARSLSRLYRLIAVQLMRSIDLALGHGDAAALNRARSLAQRARESVGESFDQLLREHSTMKLDPEVPGLMVAGADHAVSVADSLKTLVHLGYVATEIDHEIERIEHEGLALVASWFMLAEQIEGLGIVGTLPLDRDVLRDVELRYLAAWKGEDAELGKAAIAVAWTREWLEQLGTLVAELEPVGAKVAASASAPWWK